MKVILIWAFLFPFHICRICDVHKIRISHREYYLCRLLHVSKLNNWVKSAQTKQLLEKSQFFPTLACIFSRQRGQLVKKAAYQKSKTLNILQRKLSCCRVKLRVLPVNHEKNTRVSCQREPKIDRARLYLLRTGRA